MALHATHLATAARGSTLGLQRPAKEWDNSFPKVAAMTDRSAVDEWMWGIDWLGRRCPKE